ncbi:MAG: ribose ABC transporter permease, partial [Monoglobus pectinilyticus]
TMIGVLIIGVLNNGMNLLQIPFYYQLLLKGVVIVFAVYLDTMKKRKAGV